MAYFSLDQFVQTVSKQGLARDNRFEIRIPIVGGKIFSNEFSDVNFIALMCESAGIPGVNLVNRTQRITGPAYVRPTNIEYGGVAQFTFYVDREMKIKKFFDSWIHSSINPNSFTVNYIKQYAKDIEINQLDENDEVMYSVTLCDAFPSAMAEMRVNNSSQSTFHRLGVSFSYRYWKTNLINDSMEDTPTITPSNIKTMPWDFENEIYTNYEAEPPQPPTPFNPGGGQFGGGGNSGGWDD